MAYNPLPLNGLCAMALTGKRLLLGLTGGIAAYKAAELTRLLVTRGADVRVAMTEAATRFITPTTMQALSGRNVYTSQWDSREPNSMAHITLTREADAVLVSLAGGPDMTMAEVNRIMEQINRQCENAHIILGAGIQENLAGRLSVTLVASRRNDRDERRPSGHAPAAEPEMNAAPPAGAVFLKMIFSQEFQNKIPCRFQCEQRVGLCFR